MVRDDEDVKDTEISKSETVILMELDVMKFPINVLHGIPEIFAIETWNLLNRVNDYDIMNWPTT